MLKTPHGEPSAQDPARAGILVDGSAIVERYLSDLRELVGSIDPRSLGRIVEIVVAALTGDRSVFLAGNGGSASAAEHMAVDWVNAAGSAGCRAAVVNLAGSAANLTALGNDLGFVEVFARQIDLRGRPDDLVILLSVSGSSPNLVRAAQAAASRGMRTLGLLGHPGDLTRYCDHWVMVGRGDYGLTEDLHVTVNHMVARALRGGRAHRYRLAPGEGD